MAQKPPVDAALVDALPRGRARAAGARDGRRKLALKQQACQVPLSLIQNSPISLQEPMDLAISASACACACAQLWLPSPIPRIRRENPKQPLRPRVNRV